MGADERLQRALQRRLEEVLGDEHVVTLMEQLASKHDPMTLGQRLDDRMDALEQPSTSTAIHSSSASTSSSIPSRTGY